MGSKGVQDHMTIRGNDIEVRDMVAFAADAAVPSIASRPATLLGGLLLLIHP